MAERELKVGISAKETKEVLNKEDKTTAVMKKASAGVDMKTAQKLLDESIKEIETLKPTCIDTGMTYAQKVSKREEEVAALKNAMCILDEDHTEADCNAARGNA